MSIRAVIFDFGGVLCFPPNADQIARAAARCDLSPAEFLSAFWSLRIEYDAGKLSPHQYWKLVARNAGRHFNDALIAEMIEAEIDFWSRFDAPVLAWNDQLRAAGVKTAMLSNLPSPLGLRLRSQKFYEHFDHTTLSFELGVVKPHREIYEDALRGLECAPDQVLFLDDRQENIDGAVALGIRTHLYTAWDAFLGTADYVLPAAAVARRQ